MYSMTCIESVQGHFDLRLIKSICFRENSLCAENDFYIFVSVDLDSWPFELKFALQVTRIQGHVSVKFEVSVFVISSKS